MAGFYLHSNNQESSVEKTKMTAPYQIFRKLPDNKFIWIENIDELQEARGRLDFLSTISDADYILFDPRQRTVVPQLAKFIQP
jgi:hypothetical protein